MENSDEDTNGSFEFVDKITDSSETESNDKQSEHKNNLSCNLNKTENNEDDWEDILGSGQLLKKIQQKGQNNTRPQRTDICEIKYVCRFNDEIIETIDSLKFPVSDSEVIQGLDLVVPLMDIGEISEIKIGSRFAYGSKGFKDDKVDIPPNATLHYKVELISVSQEPDIETMGVETREQIGMRKKQRGNWWYSREDHVFAIQCYRRALEYLDYTKGDDDQSISSTAADKLIDERINVYNNLAAAQLKVNAPDDVIHSSEMVLRLQPNNVKALFRKGKALTVKGEKQEALGCFKRALQIDPESKLANVEIQKLQSLIAADTETERNLYKKMFEPSKSNKGLSHSNVKNTWIKLGFFVGSLAIVVFGVVIYKYNVND